MAGAKQQADAGKGQVLFVSHDYGYGGDLMYFGEIFDALRKHEPGLAIGVDKATLFANPHALDLRPLYRRRSISLPGGSGYARAIHATSPMLATRVAAMAPDVLVTVEFTPISLLAMMGSRASKNTRRVLLVESDPTFRGGSRSSAVLALKRQAVAAADVIQTNNQAGANYLVRTLGANREKLVVAPYLTSRPPGPPARPRRTKGPLRLLFANSLTERKNARVILEALAAMPKDLRENIRLTIVGDGDEREPLQDMADRAGLGPLVSFAGHCAYSQLGKYYAKADVLVSPTLQDYRSLSTFEGLGYGLALMASNRDGAARETVVEGKTGFTFSPDDAEELAQHIATLASDRAALLAMRREALDLYKKRFSLEKVAENLASSIERARRTGA